MIFEVHPDNPEKRKLGHIADILKKGGVVILPTDSVYALVALLGEKKALERIYRIKNAPVNKELSLYCRDFSQMSDYVRLSDNRIFRWMKEHLPGPFTVILEASKKIPQYTLTKQKTVGVRIIDHPVIQGLLELFDMPLIGSTLEVDDEFLSDPDLFSNRYEKQVDAIVHAGIELKEMTTVVDARDFPIEILREGKGEAE